MSRGGTRARRFLTIAVVAGASAGIAAPSAAAEQPLTVTKSTVLRDAKPIAQASAVKKKRRGRATTRSTESPFSSGTSATATGACTGKSHLTGGGFAVTPPLSGGAGIAGSSVVSFPAAKKRWAAAASAFAAPVPTSGTFTAFARCESNLLGRTLRLSLSGTVLPGLATTALLDCPDRTHAVGGGYKGTPPADASGDDSSLRTFILESRRRKATQWAVTAYTSFASPVPAPFTGYVICERNGKGRGVTQESTVTPIADNARTAGDARCGGKRHVVSGGYEVADPDPLRTVGAFFDESHPAGKKGWQVGMWESGETPLPAGGATLETFAYCKKIARSKN